ncbi:DUF1493 family protein [Serratia quinivorans]|uniref:DUF1493 family protein n=1 Tax=Serratia quinivorans TaxID=137545 RepID=UPI002179C778|nr:DUF1493 family protein [Serratia quinivorans]CAI0809779.1 Protein of uncharacterised function (DUF1493) [Serratia quinivorans]CAI0835419.1 Protein of uncharacterised function (DUF1493) [Serratia quinivorans]CAI1744436.1 Protein of uncharacterised function (DUF1493) [Serratia quinivorans]CAI2070312.1 Protein of uncharacterised function (DUF1493) [Serratia quinivorans]CAI2117798.1 Protein of uncharacterised function (DUF1493) [Serratia quinivorans]
MESDIQQQVISVVDRYNAPGLLKRGIDVTLNTEINKELNLSLPMSETLMQGYFNAFRIDSSNYNHELYFRQESKSALLFSSANRRNKHWDLEMERIRPLYVYMLVRSARAKRWLYDIHFLIEQLK